MQRHIVARLARNAIARSRVVCRPACAASIRSSALASTTGFHKFSTSTTKLSHGENDGKLASRLESELAYERENSNPATEPPFLQAFKNQGIWTVEDKAGADEVALSRKFGNEEIRVLFSIADIDNAPESAAAEEETEGLPEAEEDEDVERSAEAEQGASLPIRTAITITKGKGNGAMTIDAVAQDGMFLVDNVTLYPDEQVGTELTPEADWKRRGMYMGPAFDHLDEALQTDFEAFLEERGIDASLALFIPDLAEYKEQKEYVKWLEGVSKFVNA